MRIARAVDEGVSKHRRVKRTLTVQGDTVGDDGTALIIQESDFITEGEGSGEIIFEEGEPPLPPFPPLPFPVPPPPE